MSATQLCLARGNVCQAAASEKKADPYLSPVPAKDAGRQSAGLHSVRSSLRHTTQGKQGKRDNSDQRECA